MGKKYGMDLIQDNGDAGENHMSKLLAPKKKKKKRKDTPDSTGLEKGGFEPPTFHMIVTMQSGNHNP